MTNTRDISKFGIREKDEASDLLKAYSEGNWASDEDELGDGVSVEFNPSSGNVFLVDEDYNCAMLNGEELENWLNCSYCGNEGFRSEIEIDDDGNCPDCKGK